MKKPLLVLAFFLMICLSGCLPEWGGSLFQVPQLPGDYLSLQTQINRLAEKGAIQVSPSGGDNRHPIQMMDIDADGVEEAVSFFRDAQGSNQFTVYLHKKQGDQYVEAGSINGHGTGIDAVYYPRRLSNGALAVAVCWSMGEDIPGSISVGILEDGAFYEEAAMDYTEVFISDFGEGGVNEILTVVASGASSRFHARFHVFDDGHLKSLSSTPLSAGILGVARISQGRTSDGVTAVFIDEVSAGKGYLTDVLIKENTAFKNITLDSTSGISIRTYRPVSVPAASFAGDGTYLIPLAYPMPGYSEQNADVQWRLAWNFIDAKGTLLPSFSTYYNRAEEWYFLWPENWKDTVTVRRSASGTTSRTAFLLRDPAGGKERPLFYLYALTGDNQTDYANEPEFIRIGASLNITYYVSFPADAASLGEYAMNEERVRELFRIVPKELPSVL